MALRAGYYGLKKKFIDKVNKWDQLVFPRSEQAVLGAKNLCPMPFSAGYTLTTNGITFTVNDDGSYIADGTCGEGGAFLQFYRDYNNNILQKGKTYIASSGQTSSGGTQVYYRESYQSGDWVQLANAIESEKTFTVPNNANIILIRGYIGGGNTLSNKTYYPMIRLASDTDDTYVPYAMTNKDLTVSAADQKTAINAIITAATSAADFAAFKTAMGAITPVTRSLSTAVAREENIKDEIEEPVVEKKTTTRKKSTAKAETTEEV